MGEVRKSKVRAAPPAPARKPYVKPRLIHRGDVRDVTMGPTPGVGESGNPFTFRP